MHCAASTSICDRIKGLPQMGQTAGIFLVFLVRVSDLLPFNMNRPSFVHSGIRHRNRGWFTTVFLSSSYNVPAACTVEIAIAQPQEDIDGYAASSS
jgi:hypothetical protein